MHVLLSSTYCMRIELWWNCTITSPAPPRTQTRLQEIICFDREPDNNLRGRNNERRRPTRERSRKRDLRRRVAEEKRCGGKYGGVGKGNKGARMRGFGVGCVCEKTRKTTKWFDNSTSHWFGLLWCWNYFSKSIHGKTNTARAKNTRQMS